MRDSLAADWLRGRPMAPLGFLVAVELFHAPCEHRYLAAERGGRVIAFLSAVPIPARACWLVENVVRTPDTPNGTSEALFAALCAEVVGAKIGEYLAYYQGDRTHLGVDKDAPWFVRWTCALQAPPPYTPIVG